MINHSDFALYLTDEKGKQVCVLPGGAIPAWAEKSITNPYVLGIDPDAEGGDAPQAPPPQSGRGSGTPAWAAYAESHGVDVDGLDRGEIIAKLEEEGVAVE